MIDEERTFNKYLKDIKNMATGADSLPIWGRLDIEGRMICEKYKVKIEVIALEEEPIDDRYIATGEQGEGDNVVRIVNYRGHFVPLLSEIPSDITENQLVSSEEILGTDKRVPPSDQPEQEVQQERINTSTSGINPPVLQGHADEASLSSHQPEQETRQEGIQKKLINNYRKEAIYGTAAVIAAIVFTASAIAAVFTQPIPLAFLTGIALVIGCVCVYQLTQSHKNINELKSELGKDQKNSTHTFLEETGLKMHDLINKAISKV